MTEKPQEGRCGCIIAHVSIGSNSRSDEHCDYPRVVARLEEAVGLLRQIRNELVLKENAGFTEHLAIDYSGLRIFLARQKDLE